MVAKPDAAIVPQRRGTGEPAAPAWQPAKASVVDIATDGWAVDRPEFS
jgi:hypothetical protein